MALPGDVTTMLTSKLENKPNKEARLQQKEKWYSGRGISQVSCVGLMSAKGLWPKEFEKLW